MAANHSGFLVQSSHGTVGNFELAVPRTGGGLAHFWRNNDAAGFPWSGPNVMFGSTEEMTAAALLQSNMGPFGNLEVIALEGAKLVHNWRDDGGTWRWQGATDLGGAGNVVGVPAFVQGSHGAQGNFEVVAPLAGGGLGHWWHDNDDPGSPWNGPTPFGSGAVDAVAMIQSSFGKLEVVARVGDQLIAYTRDDGGTWAWDGPHTFAGGVAGAPALIQSSHGGQGSFELVAPLAGGGLGHWWRDNDDPAFPWHGPTIFGTGTVDAVGLVQSSFGNLELVARVGDQLAHYWRDDGGTWAWHGPFPFFAEHVCTPATEGQCTIPYNAEIVGTHAALVRTGQVLLFGFGDFDALAGESRLLDPTTGASQAPGDAHHLFCSGHAFLGDGRLAVLGGHHDDLSSIHTFNPEPSEMGWTHEGDMGNGRWYPTCTTLPTDGVLVISGTKGAGGPVSPGSPVNHTLQIYDAGGTISPEVPLPTPFSAHFPPGFSTIDLYPFVYLLPSGELLVHSRNTTRFYDPATDTWSPLQLETQHPFSRTYPGEGSSVLLPLLPTSNPPYRVRVLIVGGGGADPEALGQFTPATDTAEILDLGDPPPAWRFTQPLHAARVMPDAVLLPDGTVLVVGGSATGKADVGIDPVLETELFDPVSETWTQMCPIRVPRLYHSTAILLPSGQVLVAGKDGLFNAPPYGYPEHRIELFSPPYLFNGPRPQITGAPGAAGYNTNITIHSPDASSVETVALLRAGSVTHSFNMEQRHVGLAITAQSAGQLTVTTPPNPNVAPPGYYLLFLLNGAGVPSVGKFIRIH